jgi:MFS family permease
MRKHPITKKGVVQVAVWLLIAEFLSGSDWGVHRGLYALFTKQVLSITSFSMIGLVVSVFGVTKAVTNLACGAVSDKIGRKPMIILGLILSGIGGGIIATASSYELMLIGTAFIGLGGGASFVGIMVSLSEIVEAQKRGLIMGLFELAAYGGSSFGSLLGGVVARTLGLRAPFYTIIALSILGTLISIVLVKETKGKKIIEVKQTTVELPRQNIARSIKCSIPTYIAGFASKIMDSLVWSFLPLYLLGLRMEVLEITFVSGIFTLVWSLSQPLTGHLSDRLGRKNLVTLGLTGTSICILSYPFINNYYLFIAVSTVMGFGAALYYTPLLAMVGDVSPPSLRGTFIGGYRFFRDLGYFLGPILLGIIADTYGLPYTFYTASIILLMAMGVVYVFSRETLGLAS